MTIPNPAEDGVTHINVYSQGKTELGRLLSNFTKTPFIHPDYGMFECMEGFYYYISTGCCDEEFRYLLGFKAKQHGAKMPRVKRDDFVDVMDSGLRAKIRCNGNIHAMLKEAKLPFEHYYIYGIHKERTKVFVPVEHQWWIEKLDKIRQEIQEGVFA